MELIRVDNVQKTYKNGVNAVYDMNLDIKKGEFVFVIGASGSGKSMNTTAEFFAAATKYPNDEFIVIGKNG